MGIFLVIPLLVTGYIALYIGYGKTHTRGLQGQELYIQAASWGVGLSLLSMVIYVVCPILGKLLSVITEKMVLLFQVAGTSEAIYFANIINILIINTVCLIFIQILKSKWLFYGFYQKKLQERLLENADLLMQEIIKAMNLQTPVMIGFDDRKIYAGYILKTVDLDKNHTPYIVLSPIFSGYRNKDTLEVMKTTLYDKIDIEQKLEMVSVLLPIQHISSFRLFDQEMFDHFHPASDDTSTNVSATDLSSAAHINLPVFP